MGIRLRRDNECYQEKWLRSNFFDKAKIENAIIKAIIPLKKPVRLHLFKLRESLKAYLSCEDLGRSPAEEIQDMVEEDIMQHGA